MESFDYWAKSIRLTATNVIFYPEFGHDHLILAGFRPYWRTVPDPMLPYVSLESGRYTSRFHRVMIFKKAYVG
jgi:hypothetical protein